MEHERITFFMPVEQQLLLQQYEKIKDIRKTGNTSADKREREKAWQTGLMLKSSKLM